MLQHPNLEAWEKRLKNVLDELNDFLEDHYGDAYTLHPSRARRDTTSNKAHDGLFDIVAHFTLGKGSKYGEGYIIDLDLATLDAVSDKFRKEIESAAMRFLRDALHTYFPGQNLKVSRDGNSLKIYGDLTLGSAHGSQS